MENEIQSKYLEFQMATQQIQQLQSHMEKLENQLVEMELLKGSLDDLKNIDKKKQVFAPIDVSGESWRVLCSRENQADIATEFSGETATKEETQTGIAMIVAAVLAGVSGIILPFML